jgi:hypothetical protein
MDYWIAIEVARRSRVAPTVAALRAARFPDARRAELRAQALDAWDSRPAAWRLESASREALRTDRVLATARQLLDVPTSAVVRSRVGAAAPPPAPSGTVTQLITYRNLWDTYVTSTARGALFVQAEALKVKGGGSSTLLNPALWSNAPDKMATIAGFVADEMGSMASALVGDQGQAGGTGTSYGCWNRWANTSASALLLVSGEVLASEQACVLQAGNNRADILNACPALPNQDSTGKPLLSPTPTATIQGTTISALQAAALVAEGELQLLEDSAAGGLELAGKVATAAANAGIAAAGFLSSPGTWIAAAGLAGAILLARR